MSQSILRVPATYPVNFEQAIPRLEIIAKAAKEMPPAETNTQRVRRLRLYSGNLDNLARYGSLADQLALFVTCLDPTIAQFCHFKIHEQIDSAHNILAAREHYDAFLQAFEARITWISRADMDTSFDYVTDPNRHPL